MGIDEITNTCSNEGVATAAIASLGELFARRVRSEAHQHGLTAGAFAARAVRSFADLAGEGERRAVRLAMEGADQPVLSGFRQIIEPVLHL